MREVVGTDAVPWAAVLCGGPADGKVLAFPRGPGRQEPPDHYRVVLPPTVPQYRPEEPDAADVAALPFGLYSLAYTLGRPSMDDRGYLRYTWRGEASW